MSYGLISLASALLSVTVLDPVGGKLLPLSETQIASTFSGKAVNYDNEIRIAAYSGVFCPNGTYARPRQRGGPIRGSYIISEGSILVEAGETMLLQVFGDSNGRIFVKQDDLPLTEAYLKTPVPGWCE